MLLFDVDVFVFGLGVLVVVEFVDYLDVVVVDVGGCVWWFWVGYCDVVDWF